MKNITFDIISTPQRDESRRDTKFVSSAGTSIDDKLVPWQPSDYASQWRQSTGNATVCSMVGVGSHQSKHIYEGNPPFKWPVTREPFHAMTSSSLMAASHEQFVVDLIGLTCLCTRCRNVVSLINGYWCRRPHTLCHCQTDSCMLAFFK